MSNLQVEKKLINRFTRENYKNEVFGIEIVPVDYDIMSDMKVLNASAQGMTDKW
jgi:hypothetical protein